MNKYTVTFFAFWNKACICLDGQTGGMCREMFLYGLVGKNGLSTLSTELSTEKRARTPILSGFWRTIVDNFCETSTYPQHFEQYGRVCPHIFPSFIHEKCENRVLKLLQKRNKYYFSKYENTDQIPHPPKKGGKNRQRRFVTIRDRVSWANHRGDDKTRPVMV